MSTVRIIIDLQVVFEKEEADLTPEVAEAMRGDNPIQYVQDTFALDLLDEWPYMEKATVVEVVTEGLD